VITDGIIRLAAGSPVKIVASGAVSSGSAPSGQD
jgi:hypothetical protein